MQPFFADFIDSAMDAIIAVDENQKVILFNRTAEIVFGYRACDIMGQQLETLFPARFRDGHLQYLAEFGKSGVTARSMNDSGISFALRASGDEFPFEAAVSMMESGDKKIYSVILRDITARGQMETQLGEAEALLCSIVETIPARIFWKDRDSRYLGCNAAFAKDAGLSAPQQIAGKDDCQLAWREQADLYRADDRLVMESDTPKLGYELLRTMPDGSRQWLLISKVPLHNAEGGVIGVLGISEDISAFKKNTELLDKSRSLLEAVTQVQLQFITGAEHRATFDKMLEILLDYSVSEYGFIGEVQHDVQGAPFMRTLAISNLAWDEAAQEIYQKHLTGGMEFHNLSTLFGSVMTSGEPVISNDPAHDSRAGGRPAGHPAMRNFLGVPLYKGKEMIGMMGIANRAGGFDEQFCEELVPLGASCVGLIESWRCKARQRQAEIALQQNEERMRQAVNIAAIGLFDVDYVTGQLYWSPELRAIYGLTPDEPITINTKFELVYPPDRALVEAAARHAQDAVGDGYFSMSHRIVRRDGEMRWIKVQFQTSFAGVGDARQAVRTIGAIHDITWRKQSEEALQLAVSVYQSSREGIVVSDENNLIIDVNPAFTSITGYTLDEVKGKNPGMFQSGKHDSTFYQQMWQSIQHDGHWQGEIWDKRRDGELHAKWLTISVIRRPDGSVFRHVGQFSDITEKKFKDDLIWTQANYDALTGLPNRSLLTDRLHQAMASGVRSGKYGALISLDLDQFKRLNDTLGHNMGDRLLVEVARRLQTCVRDEDTVARMGGDEFIVVLCELSSDEKEAAVYAEQVAEKIRSQVCLPYILGATEFHTSSSAGIVLFHGNTEIKEDLLAHVDAAMYQAKGKGRNTTCFFDSSMQFALEKRSQMEGALRMALPRREFMLYYQLQVDSRGNFVGAEALLRWSNPQLGMISPAQFIPVAEESRLILPIGLWVLETACAQLALWQDVPHLRHLCVAVNVSARQFREAGFVAQVRDALAKFRIRPGGLKLELTESLVLDNVEDSIRKMKELKALGVKFSMDDFGTGYSSLSYLSRLPIDQVKIDQSFVRDITTDQSDAVIVQTIISMAQSLGMEVIAEGVELQAQREFLERRKCLIYQGYLYARPLPVDELERLLAPQ